MREDMPGTTWVLDEGILKPIPAARLPVRCCSHLAHTICQRCTNLQPLMAVISVAVACRCFESCPSGAFVTRLDGDQASCLQVSVPVKKTPETLTLDAAKLYY